MNASARLHGKSVAEIDLAFWTFSILKRLFSPFQARQAVNQPYQITSADRKVLRAGQRGQVAKRIFDTYLGGLAESTGDMRAGAMAEELCAVFALIRNESASYARNKPVRVRERVARVIRTLDSAIESRNLRRLLGLWINWNDLVNPASPNWIGIDLPGSMVLEGFMIREDFVDLKRIAEKLRIRDGSVRDVDDLNA